MLPHPTDFLHVQLLLLAINKQCVCTSLYLQNAAKRRQARLLQMHQTQEESDREYYEQMIRQAKITASAQSNDSDMVGRLTTGSGYSEMLALREMETPQGWTMSNLTFKSE